MEPEIRLVQKFGERTWMTRPFQLRAITDYQPHITDKAFHLHPEGNGKLQIAEFREGKIITIVLVHRR